MGKEVQPDNAYMHAYTAAGPAFFRASLQAILRCMTVLVGIRATCLCIVKAADDFCSSHSQLPHMGYCVCATL